MNASTKTTASSNSTTTNSTPIANPSRAQFVHEAGYARKAAAKSAWCASDIIAEALRIRGHCGHVTGALPPIHHYGVGLDQLQSWLTALETASKSVKASTKKGARAQRRDTPIMIGAVYSIPNHPRERDQANCVAWREKTIQWVRQHYGDDRIACILEHIDEEHQHLHVLVHNHGASVKAHMAGHSAKLQAALAGVDKSELGKAYRSGCIALQDDYWSAVGSRCGLSRLSPNPRKRRTRQAHLSEVRSDLEEQVRLATVARENAVAAEADWNRKLAEIDQLRSIVAPDAIVERERRLAQGERNLAKAEDFVRARRAEIEAQHATRMREVDDLLERLSPEDREQAQQKIARRMERAR